MQMLKSLRVSDAQLFPQPISQREGYELFALEKLSWEQEKEVPDEN